MKCSVRKHQPSVDADIEFFGEKIHQQIIVLVKFMKIPMSGDIRDTGHGAQKTLQRLEQFPT